MKIELKLILVILVVALLVGILVTGGCFSTPQENSGKTEKVYHVGILSGLKFFADIEDGFREKMTELGYIEGKNIVYDSQKKENFDMAGYKSILKKFKDDKVDLILVFPTEASQEAKLAASGTGIPVVFANAFTEDTGLVNSVRQPGGDITGVRWGGPDLALQRYEIMRELVPQAKRMLIPYQKDYPIIKSQLEAVHKAAAADGITLIEVSASNATDLEAKLQEQAAAMNSKTDVIFIIAEPLCVSPDSFAVLAKFATDHNIPYGGVYNVAAGGYETIYGLTPQSVPQGRQAAVLADKIFKGTPAGDIPVVTAENYFHLSYRAAQKFGLNVSEGLLNRADKIIR